MSEAAGGFYVYEYVHHEGRQGEVRTVLHVHNCRWCQDGKGRPTNAGMQRGLGRWHGPFGSVGDALDAAGMIAEPLACRHCRPY